MSAAYPHADGELMRDVGNGGEVVVVCVGGQGGGGATSDPVQKETASLV